MNLSDALLDSWDRQAQIVRSLAQKVDETNRLVRPSPDGWTLEFHLAHIHQVRRYWLHQLSLEKARTLPKTIQDDWQTLSADLAEVRLALDASAKAIRKSLAERIAGPLTQAGAYDNPVLFLQHMVWHEGWHVGLLMLGLRQAGQEPTEEWQETHLWGPWRTE